MTGFLTHAIMEKKIAEVKEMGLFDRLIKRKQKQNYKPLVIYGLCGPVGVGAHKSGEARYWTASIILRAWKEEGSEALHEEKIRLEKTCDEDGVHALQEQLRKNAIFHAKVRMSEQGLELLELLEPDCDEPQLAALRGVQEDARTETAVDPEVAEGRCRIQTFAKEKTRLYFEGKQEEGIRILHAMQKRQVGWYNDAVNYAADRAVPKYNETLRSGERKLTKKAFREQVRLAKIVISDNERFVFWLDTTDLVKDAVIGVSGRRRPWPISTRTCRTARSCSRRKADEGADHRGEQRHRPRDGPAALRHGHRGDPGSQTADEAAGAARRIRGTRPGHLHGPAR